MIILNEKFQNLEHNSQTFQLRGFCISEVNSSGNLEIIFQKGIGITLTQKIIDLYKDKITQKRQGYIKDIIGDLTIYLHFFEKKPEIKLIIMYIDRIDNGMNYTELYHISKQIYNYLSSNTSYNNIKNFCDYAIKIPKAMGIIGVFIIDKAGFLYFSKVNKNRTNMANHNYQIAGFLSTILIYSHDFFDSQEYGLKLEDINLGGYHLFLKTKNNLIFAYMVDKDNTTKNIKRYMQLIMEEFIDKYSSHIKSFKGDLTPFHKFEKVIDQYFEI